MEFLRPKHEALKRQVERWLKNLGNARSLALLMDFDPLFGDFLKEECEVNKEVLDKAHKCLTEVANQLINKDGIVTETNIKKWLNARGWKD
jgi:hypothetical protein